MKLIMVLDLDADKFSFSWDNKFCIFERRGEKNLDYYYKLIGDEFIGFYTKTMMEIHK